MMRIGILIVAIGGMSLAGCDSASSRAQEIAARDLKDPSSAQFRDVREAKGGAVCGEMNGKNAFGAYTGFKRFVVRAGATSVVTEPDEPMTEAEQQVATDRCRDSSGLGYAAEHSACEGVTKLTEQIKARSAFRSAYSNCD